MNFAESQKHISEISAERNLFKIVLFLSNLNFNAFSYNAAAEIYEKLIESDPTNNVGENTKRKKNNFQNEKYDFWR